MSAGASLACLPTRLQLSFLVIEVYISLGEVVFACVLLILKQLNLVLHMRHYLAILECAQRHELYGVRIELSVLLQLAYRRWVLDCFQSSCFCLLLTFHAQLIDSTRVLWFFSHINRVVEPFGLLLNSSWRRWLTLLLWCWFLLGAFLF